MEVTVRSMSTLFTILPNQRHLFTKELSLSRKPKLRSRISPLAVRPSNKSHHDITRGADRRSAPSAPQTMPQKKIHLSGGVLLVVVLDGLDSRIADEELVPEAADEAEGDALHGRDDEAAEGRAGAESAGLAGQRTGPVEGGVAVDDAGHVFNKLFPTECAELCVGLEVRGEREHTVVS